ADRSGPNERDAEEVILRRLWPLVLAGGIIAAAAPTLGCASNDCSIASPDWPTDLSFMVPDSHEFRGEIYLQSGGGILFDGPLGGEPRSVSLVELVELLSVIKDLTPAPWLIFRVSPAADCEDVRSLRAELERRSLCRNRNCITAETWDRTFGPPVSL
ncbi:MAG: hypothetical protein ACXWU2_02950, partial [Allosphingosinicella sp.]